MYFSGIHSNMKRKVEDSVTDAENVEETTNSRKKKVRFEEHKAKNLVKNVKGTKKVKFEKSLNNKTAGEKEIF